MKTKVAWVVLIALMLFITCTVAGAETFYYYSSGYGYYSHSHNLNRTRWSVYEHKLISGDFYYSPYAFKYGHSGLVNKEFYYSPYAFKYGQNGLISQYDARPYCPGPIVVVQPNPSFDQLFKQETEQQKRYQENVEARRRRVEQRKKNK